jgi:hypothetical protein
VASRRSSRGARTGGSDRRTALLRDVAHLTHLIDVMRDRGAQDGVGGREPELITATRSRSVAEQQLRAVSALLSTLDTYLRTRRRCAVGDDPTAAGGAASLASQEEVTGARQEATGLGPRSELAAAAASYIARDLAARQLTEFTSAEAYRLARALARIGGVSTSVERWLAEANTIRLHPAPLRDAVSHSAG